MGFCIDLVWGSVWIIWRYGFYRLNMGFVWVWYGGCMGFVSVRSMGLVWVLFGFGVSLVYGLGRGLV